MRAMMVKIGFEIEQFAFEIGSCPEQRTIQTLSAERANQPLDKGMGEGNIGDGFDLGHLQDSQVGLPLMETVKRIMVGAEVLGHPALPSKGAVEHPAKGYTVDGPGMDAERPGNLLSDSRAAPGGIALLGGDNRINEFFGRAPGAGLEPALRREEQAVLALGKDLVKVQKGGRLQNDGGTEEPRRPYKQSAPTGDDAIREAEIRSALARTIED
jgi:hypothetical protein